MRTIHGVLLTAVMLGVLRAQGPQAVMVGMPEYGVALSGSPGNPVIENHSGRVVIGYDMKLADASGRGMILSAQILALSVLPAGIPDGRAIYAIRMAPVGPNFQMGGRVMWPGQGQIIRATLRSVIFGDGQFVGTDEQGAFEEFAKRLKAVSEVGIMAKNQAWDQIEAIAHDLFQTQPPLTGYTFRQLAASRLAQERKFRGNAAAAQLAEIYSSLPTFSK